MLQSRPKRRVSFVRPRNAHVCPSRSEHACSCTRIDPSSFTSSSSSSSSFVQIEELHFSGNRNGIYVRGDDTRIVESKSEFTRFRRLVENSSPRTVPFRLAPTFELLTRRWPMFTANHDDTLSLSLSLSTDPLFFRRGDTWQASRSKRAHAHTTMFRFSFPSPPRPLNFTPVSNRMTRMRIDSTETIAFRIHSKKGWSVMGYNTWASVYLLT